MTDGGGLWDAVVGQPAATRLLHRAVERDEVPHALLFVGLDEVGQREAAAALAAAINCPEADPGWSCGTCSTCRRVAAGAHPAFLTFEPEGATHVVDSVRDDWIPAATRTLVEGRRKVLRIVAADRMNEPAQNAFLKVLEEPPASVVWILEVEDEGALLETVVSRCRRLDFVPWSPPVLRDRAVELGVPQGQVDALVRAAMGSPTRLADLTEPEVAAARQEHLGLVGRLVDEGPGAVVPIAKELDTWARDRTKVRRSRNEEEMAAFEDAFGGEWPPGVRRRLERRFSRQERRERHRALEFLLDNLASYLRDLLLVGAGGDASGVVNLDCLVLVRRDAERVPAPVALDALDAVAECRDALERHGHPELHLERLLLRIAVPLYRVS